MMIMMIMIKYLSKTCVMSESIGQLGRFYKYSLSTVIIRSADVCG
jgi:hypothetical protein